MSLKYRADIDGLRAVAVGLVVAYHAFPEYVPGGFVGVDIFFVISGYLVTSILLKEHDRGTYSLLSFYERRVRRLFPALLLVLAAVLVAGWFLLYPDEYVELGRHAFAGAFFVSNVVSWMDAGYFDAQAGYKPLLHLWSLAVEEQFYLVFPLLLALAVRAKAGVLILIAAGIAASFLYGLWVLPVDPASAYFLPQSRFWQLLIGSALGALHWEGLLNNVQVGGAPSFVGMALMVGTAFAISPETPFPGWWAVPPTIGAAMFIASSPSNWVNRMVALRPLVWVGLISYPLYLWHWPLLSFAWIVEAEQPGGKVRLALVGVSVALAALTYLFVERRVRHGLTWKWAPIGMAASVFLVGLAGHLVVREQGVKQRPGSTVIAAQAEFMGALWPYVSNDLCLNSYPFSEVEKLRWWFCSQNRPGSPEILLMGNSYANQMYPGLVNTEPFAHHVILSIGTCEPIAVRPEEAVGVATTSACQGPRRLEQQSLINGIIEEHKPKLVIMAGLSETPDDIYIDRLIERILFAQENGSYVVLVKPTVKLGADIRSCFARPLKTAARDCRVAADSLHAVNERLAPMFDAVQERAPETLVFSVDELFCREDGCSFLLDGLPLLRDEWDHWSEFGSTRSAVLLTQSLSEQRVWPFN